MAATEMMNSVQVVSARSPARRALGLLGGRATLGPFAALLLAVAFFSFESNLFLRGPNLSLILQQSVEVGTLAIGQTLIVLTAGIDLSCGLVMAFGMIVMTKLAVDNGVSPYVSILLGLGACAGFGLLNGVLVTRIKLPAFIVTLGTLNIATAIVQIYSQQQTIESPGSVLTYFGRTFALGGTTTITYGVVVMLGLFAFFGFLLSQTAWGTRIYALGSSAASTRLSGVRTDRLLVSVYVVAGLIYGVAALLLIGRTGVGDPNAGTTDNLDSITAVVLGGTSLFGGRGRLIGTLFGTLIVGVIRNGLVLMGVDSIYQILITGILVILAVSVDQLTRRRSRG